MRLSLAGIAAAVRAVGDLGNDPERVLTGVSTDSRKVRSGDLFVCLPGERFDGHAFAAEAVRQGAAAILAQRPLEADPGAPVLLVPDSLTALGDLAACQRGLLAGKVVGISGSAGKTTLKEMLAGILSSVGKTARNFKNWNNAIGLPLSLLATDGDEDFVVMEAGINQPGEMDILGSILTPDLAVIHNVGPAHLEGLGSVAGVAAEKTRMFRYLRPGGAALVSADYPELVAAAHENFHRVLTFSSRGAAANFTARRVQAGEAAGSGQTCDFNLGGVHLRATLPWAGEHMLENGLAALGAASLLGLTVAELERGLAAVRLPGQRFECRDIGEWLVIDDTYNANPLSMAASLESARTLAGNRPLVLVLGGMRELGADSAQAHLDLGRKIGQTAPAALFFTGDGADEVERGLRACGLEHVFHRAATPAEFLSGLGNSGIKGGVILFKGSRSYKMENYHQAFVRECRA